jgi:hypothetical protein
MANPRRRIELTIRSEVLVVQRGGHEVILLYRPTNLFIDLLMAALVIYAHLLCNFSEADWRAPSSELKQATPLPIMVDNALAPRIPPRGHRRGLPGRRVPHSGKAVYHS